MPRPAPLRRADVIALRRAVSHGGDERTALLHEAAARPLRTATALREWHDLLLFVVAHPRSVSEWKWAQAELDRVPAGAAALPVGTRPGLLNSGVAGAPVEGSFSLALVRWLVGRWPGQVLLTQVDAPLDDVRDVLRALVLPVERELVDAPVHDADAMLSMLFGANRSRWLPLLLDRFDALPMPEAHRAQWFARLHAWVQVADPVTDGALAIPAATCAVTQARAPSAPPFTHPDGLQRGVDLATIMAQPAPPPLRLAPSAAQQLIDTARTVLVTLARETDPITYASAVTLHDMGRGLRIALFSLDVPHRLPFDSYVGFMAFRNGVPLAYGGAWIVPGRSKVGINVFPAQRGGESAWFFAQLLRLYRGRHHVDRFEVEHYQLGYRNPEGLRSGAYWFYYRIGFRPPTPALRRVAERAFTRLSRRTDHVVPRRELLTLVEAGLELVMAGAASPTVDAGELTAAVSRHVVRRHAGDRHRALARARQRVHAVLRDVLPTGGLATWSTASRAMLDQWLLALDLVDDLERWPRTERRRLAEVIRAKGEADETRHQQRLRAHTRLLACWARTISD
ncbi:MAG: hypothetical protein ACK6DP_13075 [Gemmatimonas sp.]|jgi:hypothetical protein|uniref:hypothetical protein n=1 Tax=Gemmatimonas sp. TaxID=1962908 RepID=UPI00391F86BE|nr:hypothetical protein [Gemmatimonadota bacterium]